MLKFIAGEDIDDSYLPARVREDPNGVYTATDNFRDSLRQNLVRTFSLPSPPPSPSFCLEQSAY